MTNVQRHTAMAQNCIEEALLENGIVPVAFGLHSATVIFEQGKGQAVCSVSRNKKWTFNPAEIHWFVDPVPNDEVVGLILAYAQLFLIPVKE